MGLSFPHSAPELKEILQKDASKGTELLVQYVSERTLNPRSVKQALLLSSELNFVEAEENRGLVLEEIFALIDQVESTPPLPSLDENPIQQAKQELKDKFSGLSVPNEIVFECKGLTKTYKKEGFTLGPVDLTLRQSEITGVVGKNANGKTTLFKLVAGVTQQTAGDVTFPLFGEKLNWTQVKQQIAYVPQELPSWSGSLEKILKFEAAIHGIKGEANRKEVNFIIERLDLRTHLDKSWDELSGGFKLRFSLAKALIWKPKLLIIDEPLANLDPETQLKILSDLRDMANSLRYPISILISSQHLHEIEAISDNILFLEMGNPVYYGPTGEIGKDRSYNTFEIGTSVDINQLKVALGSLSYQELYQTRLSYVLKVPRETDAYKVLQGLMEGKVPILYFRDISQSIKQLF